MSHHFNNEMISAYLDGELTVEERALVEQTLATSPEHQQVLNDLRALRDSFQNFPSYSLDEKFSERVLRAAERYMLTENSEMEAAASHVSPGTTGPDSIDGTKGNRRTWQLAVASVAAIAALLLLALFLADRHHPATEVSNVAPHDRHEASNSDKKAENRELGKEQSAATLDDAPADHRFVGETGGAGRRATMPPAAGDRREEKRASEPAASPAPMSAQSGGYADTAELHEGGLGGGVGRPADQPSRSLRTAVGGRKSDAQLTAETTSADIADGQSHADADDDGLGAFDFTIVVEVPIKQLSEQPVEVALAESNVRDADKLARAVDSLRKSFAENRQRNTTRALPPSGPSADRERDRTRSDDVQPQLTASGEQTERELLVVATVAELKAVCETLNRRGLKTVIGSPSLARQVELMPGGGAMQFQQSDAAAIDSPRQADKNEVAENPQNQATAGGKVAEAKKAAAEPVPAKPVASAEKRPRANKQSYRAPPDAARDENVRGTADADVEKESVDPSGAENSRSSLKGQSSAYGAATETEAGTMQESATETLEKQKNAEVAESYFFRVAGREATAGVDPDEELAQDAPQTPASKDEVQKPSDSTAGVGHSARGAPTSEAGQRIANQRQAVSRLHVRIIIRSTP